MLKGIPDIISPDLLKVLHEMGHGDSLAIVDGNFPAASNAKRLIRYDGHGLIAILDAILNLYPLDTYVEQPVLIMQVVPGDKTVPEIHDEIRKLVADYDPRGDKTIGYIERFDFYEQARNAYAIVSTTERKLYGCVLLKKGIIR